MRSTSLLHATPALLLASCSPITQVCTLIGCDDLLEVQCSRTPDGPVRVEAFTAPGAEPRVVECPAEHGCSTVSFRDLVAERVTIRVTTAAGIRSQEFTPRYENQYPNGRRCGAVCTQATITFQL